MIVRELLTKIGFTLDESGLKKAEQAINQFKSKLNSIQKTAAKVKFSVDTEGARKKIKAFSDEILKGDIRPTAELNLKTDKARAAITALSREFKKSVGGTGGGTTIQPTQQSRASSGAGEIDALTSSIRRAAAAWLTYEGAKKAATTLDTTQNLEARLKLLDQTTTSAGEAFDFVADRAIASRSSLDAYGTFYVRLANAGKAYLKTSEDVAGITDTISKALVVSGATQKESASMLLQLSQAIGSTTLQGQEFNAVAEAAPMYLEQLSKALGIPRENLKKMASEGQITSKQVIEATRKMAGFFEEKFKQMPMTIGQSFEIINTRFQKMMGRMNRDSGLVKTITSGVLSAFDAIERGVNRLVDAFGGWDSSIRVIGATIAAALGAKAISVLMKLNAASLVLMGKWALVAAAIAFAGLAIEDFYVYTQGGSSIIGDFIESLGDTKYTLLGVVTSIGSVLTAFGLMKAALIIQSALTGAYKVALVALKAVQKAIAITSLAMSLAMSLNPIGLIVIAIGALIAAGALLIANWDTVKKWFTDFFGWMEEKFTKLGKWASNIPGRIFNAGKEMLGFGGGPSVTPSSIQNAGGNRSVSNNTTVNVTVPAGTPEAQVDFLKQSAKKSFDGLGSQSLANDYTIYAP